MLLLKILLGALVIGGEYLVHSGKIRPIDWLEYNEIIPAAPIILNVIHYGILGVLVFLILAGPELFSGHLLSDIGDLIIACLIIGIPLDLLESQTEMDLEGCISFIVYVVIIIFIWDLFWDNAIKLFGADLIAIAVEYVIALIMYILLKPKQDQLEKERAEARWRRAEEAKKQAEEQRRQKEEWERQRREEREQRRNQLQSQIDDLNNRIYVKRNALFDEVSKAIVNQDMLTATEFNQMVASANYKTEQHGSMADFLQDLLFIFNDQAFSFTDEQKAGLHNTLDQIKGQSGEDVVASYLVWRSDCIVLRSLDIPFKYANGKQGTNQLDVMCLMPSGIYILEVKHWINWQLLEDNVHIHWAKKGNNKLVFEYHREDAKPEIESFPHKDGQRTVVDQISDHVQAVKELLENNGLGELTKYVNGWLVIGVDKTEQVTVQSVPGSPQIYLPWNLYNGMTQEKETVLSEDQLSKVKQLLLVNNQREKKYPYTYLIPTEKMLALMYDGGEHQLLRMMNEVDVLKENLNSIE